MRFVQFVSMRREGGGRLTVGELASKMSRLKVVGENLTEEERASFIQDLYHNVDEDVDFESFLRVSNSLNKSLKKRERRSLFLSLTHSRVQDFIDPLMILFFDILIFNFFCFS